MPLTSSSYDQLCKAARDITLLHGASAVLGWDQETYMPEKGVEHRSRILSYLSGEAHEKFTSKRFGKLLEQAEKEVKGAAATSAAKANVTQLRREFDRATKLSKKLVEENSKAISLGQAAWAKARAESDFPAFAPHLEKLVGLSMEIAERWGGKNEPYDALLDQHERDSTAKDIDTLFTALRPHVAKIAQEAVERSKAEAPPEKAMLGNCPIEKQQKLNREVAESVGFDFQAGRIDTTAHPFCSGFGPGDVRLTTRYDERDFLSSLFGVLHEAGHGMYDQGLLEKEWGLPSGTAVSLGIHESQSRLWENHVGRSRAFWEKWYPRATSLFPHLKKLKLDQFLLGVNRAEFSFIRVEADEATYDLHIMLRFAMERRIFSGALKVSEVPDAWNAEFEKSFGRTPPDARRGCLQDIHWSMGGFGYFPTYTLGNLNAAQLFSTAMKKGPIRKGVEKAEYAPLLGWLRENVHAPGSTLSPAQLMEHATGKGTTSAPYLKHLRTRFLGAA
ncbi:MAG TPA: carboxypeptidase M32 [Candidatus Saccharimonadia bacterium]|nr:carboxypeptidase M32 [Candidatus Saccharimonadia bacterium]